MEPEIDPEEESLCRPPLNARNGDWCPVVGPPDLFVSCYSNPIHATLELVRWPKRKLYFKSVRNAPQLMATREELTEKDSIKDENRHTTDTIELQERALTLYKEWMTQDGDDQNKCLAEGVRRNKSPPLKQPYPSF
ncbi:MAG: hypothetical protein M1813_004149 [Trichoglossum hirsutum]|nr:MAG: hypothetical protein M1813_004149 [Trichoglossum hirsutum]